DLRAGLVHLLPADGRQPAEGRGDGASGQPARSRGIVSFQSPDLFRRRNVVLPCLLCCEMGVSEYRIPAFLSFSSPGEDVSRGGGRNDEGRRIAPPHIYDGRSNSGRAFLAG